MRRQHRLDFGRLVFSLGLFIERRGNTWTTWTA
jgi:hypothetical protein